MEKKTFTEKDLIEKALEARKKAYVPYSHFAVGAALLAENGRVYTGCNIENATFTPTICAERTAFFGAVAGGVRKFKAIAVVGGKEEEDPRGECPPCGVCRQVMREFCDDDFKIILGTPENFRVYKLTEILPLSFSVKNIQ